MVYGNPPCYTSPDTFYITQRTGPGDWLYALATTSGKCFRARISPNDPTQMQIRVVASQCGGNPFDGDFHGTGTVAGNTLTMDLLYAYPPERRSGITSVTFTGTRVPW